MKRVDQTIEGRLGNCMTACIASIFELPLEPLLRYKFESRGWEGRLQRWLKRGNLCYFETMLSRQQIRGDCLCVLIGPSVRSRASGADHAVVGRIKRGRVSMVHDPHWSRDGLTHINRVGVFVAVKP